MGIPVLIIGKSGTGKTSSLRNCVNSSRFGLIKAINKPLPFRGTIPSMQTDDYSKILAILSKSKAPSMIIDDAGYLITNYFMRNHSKHAGGNAVFGLYNTLADNYWNMVQFIIEQLPENRIVYIIMHEDTNDFGEVKPKTIGKLLDEKICLEGMFTIVLRCVIENGNEHRFITQYSEGAVSKSPMGMFDDLSIDNDLLYVDNTIRAYYNIEAKEETNNEQA